MRSSSMTADAVGPRIVLRPVGDYDARAAHGEGVEALLYALLRDGVERARGLVHDEYGRVLEEDAGDAQALLLPAGEHGRPARPQRLS